MKKIVSIMNYLDDEYISEASPEKAKPMKRIRRGIASMWLSAGACVAAAALVFISVFTPYVYTAEDINKAFGATNDGVTSSYQKVYVPSGDHLRINPVEYTSTISIYKYKDSGSVVKSPDKQELQNLADSVFARFFEKTGTESAELELKKYDEDWRDDYSECYRGSLYAGDYLLSADQTATENTVMIFKRSESDRSIPISLGNVKLEIDGNKTNEELLSGLDDIKAAVFELFGTSFRDVEIVRHYNGHSECVSNLKIIFYNSHPLDEKINSSENYFYPLSDYISLSFDGKYSTGDILTNGIITYVQKRVEGEKLVKRVKKAEMITLAEAEELLFKGYVFGSHSCPTCMAEQEKVDFEGYDYVSLEYLFKRNYDTGEREECLPFYAFYKYIGDAENGNQIYAKTYVCALKVKGYEEFFEKQAEDHSN